LEKRRTWSDCDGDVEKRFTKDELLTTMTLYWVTQSFSASARYYYEAAHNCGKIAIVVLLSRRRKIVFTGRCLTATRLGGDTTTSNAGRSPSGGHFASMEEPELLVNDIRAFFRTLRSWQRSLRYSVRVFSCASVKRWCRSHSTRSFPAKAMAAAVKPLGHTSTPHVRTAP
jgi:hypothetical protein